MSTEYTPLGIGVGSQIAGRYEIVRRLGAGAMSVVYLVSDYELNREQVALKLLAPKQDDGESSVERFRNELLLTRKLTHPCIVRTHDFGQTSTGQYYITMEYVPGTNLDMVIRSTTKPIAINEITHLLFHTAQAISFAHSQGVIHRDLKPGNILLGENGEIKITDFGLARMIDVEERLTKVGDCVGTPSYMSPEQIREKPLDGRVDVYALGIIAFELCTGQLPFRGPSWIELAKKILEAPFPDVSKFRRNTPPWLKDFIECATKKDADERFQSMQEASEVLGSHAPGAAKDKNTEVFLMARSTVNRKPNLHYRSTVARPTAKAVDWLKLAPLTLSAMLLVVLLIALIGVGEKTTEQFEGIVEKHNPKFERFVGSLEKLNKLVVQSYENQDHLDQFLKRQTDAASQLEQLNKAQTSPALAQPNQPSEFERGDLSDQSR